MNQVLFTKQTCSDGLLSAVGILFVFGNAGTLRFEAGNVNYRKIGTQARSAFVWQEEP